MSSRHGPERFQWRELESVLERALDCPPEELEAFLEEVSGRDHELGREVRSLLDASRRFSYLDLPGLRGEGDTTRRLAGYELEHELGRGGMGVVYYATRREGEPRQAAIKLLEGRPGASSKFRTERAILSRLEHPNIARLLDGGPSPVPFLVMEYVDGRRIDADCEARELSIEARLERFATICDAVHYAHQNLVIHCDLKPSNILVDADGVPRLLDFGIARLLDGEAPTDATRTASPRPLTVDYASPELLDGRPATTASDVYSLGVLLFELLTGRTPFRLQSLGRQEIRHVLEQDHPPMPSAVHLEGEAHGAGSVSCGLAPPALARRLTGDVDSIVRTALRFSERERYASAAELARDVRRHLDGLPIQARPPSPWYAARKWVRRHRFASGALAFAVSSILAFAGAMAVQNAAILRAQEKAQRSYEASQAAGEFVIELFRNAHHLEIGDGSITFDQMVDRSAEQLGHSFSEAPASRAAVDLALGNLYTHLERYAEAKRFLESSLAYWRSVADTNYEAEALGSLGRVYRLECLYDNARELLEQAIVSSEQGSASRPRQLSKLLLERGYLELDLGRYDEAEASFQRTLEMRLAMHGEGSLLVANGRIGLGQARFRSGRLASAEELLTRGFEVQTEILGPGHLLVGMTANALGLVYRSQGRFVEAEALFEQTLEIYGRTRGRDHPSLAAPAMNLAIVLGSVGEYDRAIPLFERSISIERQRYSEPHLAIGNGLHNLGTALDLSGDWERAIEVYGEAVATYEAVYGPEHVSVAATLNNLGTLHLGAGRLGRAEASLRRAAAIYEGSPSEKRPRRADVLSALAEILRLRGDLEPALVLLDESVRIYESASASHPNLHIALGRRGRLGLELGSLEEAGRDFARGLALTTESLPPHHAERLERQIDHIRWLFAVGRLEEAERRLRDLLEAAEDFEPRHRDQAGVQVQLAAAELHLGYRLAATGRENAAHRHLAAAVERLAAAEPRPIWAERDLALALLAVDRLCEARAVAHQLQVRGLRFPELAVLPTGTCNVS